MNASLNEPLEETGRQAEDDLARYRSVSSKSVCALALGLLSTLAVTSPLLWIIPALGSIVSVLALREIRERHDILSGRNVALLGLTLSLLIGTATVSRYLTRTWWLRGEAQQVSQLWFQLLAEGEPHKAHQLTVGPLSRQPLDESLWDYYRTAPKASEAIGTFVDDPLVRAMLDLRGSGQVRYWATVEQISQGATRLSLGTDQFRQIYCVTFSDDSGKTSFFVELVSERTIDHASRQSGWQILNYSGGVDPELGTNIAR